jgi:hypothetical protein
MGMRMVKVLLAASVVSGGSATVAPAAGRQVPKSTNGNPVSQVAAGLPPVTTSFAFGAGQVFAGNEGSETGSAPGGVFVLRRGSATLLPDSPGFVFGLAWHRDTLYVSTGSRLLAWSDWTGSDFARRRTIYTAPRGFGGFNGLGFGANDRLYAAVDTGNSDHGPSTTPFARDILSFTAAGKHLRIVARGIRQPWQMVFPSGSSSPFVSDLGQDSGATDPPDFVLRVKQGDDYGFPSCNWTALVACPRFTKPFARLAPHTDDMGLGILGGRLYISEFGALSPPQVVSMPLRGGPVKPLLTGFRAPIVGLGIHSGWLYVGELTGQVFRVRPQASIIGLPDREFSCRRRRYGDIRARELRRINGHRQSGRARVIRLGGACWGLRPLRCSSACAGRWPLLRADRAAVAD